MAGERLIPLLALQFQVYIWMDGGAEEQKNWGKSNHYYQELIHQLFIYITPIHSEKYNTATVGFHKRKVDGLMSI